MEKNSATVMYTDHTVLLTANKYTQQVEIECKNSILDNEVVFCERMTKTIFLGKHTNVISELPNLHAEERIFLFFCDIMTDKDLNKKTLM